MTIRQQYQKARRNYMQRVRYYQSRGYQIAPIEIPKNPTRASIRRLEKQTGKKLQTSTLIDLSSGEVLENASVSTKKAVAKQNVNLLQFKKEIDRAMRRDNIGEIVNISGSIPLPSQDDIILERFIETIDLFIPPVREFLREKVAELTRTPESRRALIKTMSENPDYIPVPSDSNIGTISYKIAELERILNLNLRDTNDLMDDLTDIVESEE